MYVCTHACMHVCTDPPCWCLKSIKPGSSSTNLIKCSMKTFSDTSSVMTTWELAVRRKSKGFTRGHFVGISPYSVDLIYGRYLQFTVGSWNGHWIQVPNWRHRGMLSQAIGGNTPLLVIVECKIWWLTIHMNRFTMTLMNNSYNPQVWMKSNVGILYIYTQTVYIYSIYIYNICVYIYIYNMCIYIYVRLSMLPGCRGVGLTLIRTTCTARVVRLWGIHLVAVPGFRGGKELGNLRVIHISMYL